MALTRTQNLIGNTTGTPLRLGIALGWLCLAAARASADGPAVPLAHGFTTPTASAAAAPLLLPLNVQFGQNSGVSLLYNLSAASPTESGKPAAPRAATYGFSNALAFGHDALHLNGLMYLANGPDAHGKSKASSAVSQALAFENKGWKLDAHYQSVGKDFGAADALKGAAPSLGLASGMTADTAGRLEGLRGQNDLGFGLAHTDARGSFGASFKENNNSVSHLKTTEQALTLGHSFGRGLLFEAGRNTLDAKPTQGGSGALTTTMDHLKLGMQGAKGLSFSAEANMIGDTKGRAEQHLAYGLVGQLKDTHFAAHFGSNSLQSGLKDGGKVTDQALGVDLDRQTKGLGIKASFLQLTATGKDGNRAERTIEHLEMNWQAQRGVALAGHWDEINAQTAKAGGAGRDEKRDLTATLDALRLRGLRNSRAVLSLAQIVSQGKMQSDTRALCFDSDMPDTHVHLEYTGVDSGWDRARTTLVSRAVRVASIAPGDWLHYSAYYKARSQAGGKPLADVRDYAVAMRLKRVTLSYHYLNQQEQPDGSVRDTVLSHYGADGALTRTLAWNLQYEHTDDRADKSGLECWLAGFKGDISPHESIVLMLGRPELRVDGTTVPGQTFKMTFICKLDETDSVALNGEVTNWSRKTKGTPSTVTGDFRLDVNKGF